MIPPVGCSWPRSANDSDAGLSLYLMTSQEETEPLPWTSRLSTDGIKKIHHLDYGSPGSNSKLTGVLKDILNFQRKCSYMNVYWIPHKLRDKIVHTFNNKSCYIHFIGLGDLWEKPHRHAKVKVCHLKAFFKKYVLLINNQIVLYLNISFLFLLSRLHSLYQRNGYFLFVMDCFSGHEKDHFTFS